MEGLKVHGEEKWKLVKYVVLSSGRHVQPDTGGRVVPFQGPKDLVVSEERKEN